ncbi:MAG: metal-binding protein [Ruminococcaceae bacterium]|nr:metal-binding protein [Oscillospiraceae bacterium]
MSYKFFENKDCEYYPCHRGIDRINCLFCFCPLYEKECGGNYKILENGKKDCSDCVFPHLEENYAKIIKKL